MDSNYVFLCGVMWCNYGAHAAGKELVRATASSDPNTKAGLGNAGQRNGSSEKAHE